ncbi:hypothetical protein GCM10009605_48160 [Nocardiopsis composta]
MNRTIGPVLCTGLSFAWSDGTRALDDITWAAYTSRCATSRSARTWTRTRPPRIRGRGGRRGSPPPPGTGEPAGAPPRAVRDREPGSGRRRHVREHGRRSAEEP